MVQESNQSGVCVCLCLQKMNLKLSDLWTYTLVMPLQLSRLAVILFESCRPYAQSDKQSTDSAIHDGKIYYDPVCCQTTFSRSSLVSISLHSRKPRYGAPTLRHEPNSYRCVDVLSVWRPSTVARWDVGMKAVAATGARGRAARVYTASFAGRRDYVGNFKHKQSTQQAAWRRRVSRRRATKCMRPATCSLPDFSQ